MARLAIIIPAHNEEHRIAAPLERYCEHFGDRARLIVVLNGCSDGTRAVVSGLARRHSNLSMIDVPAAIGKGGAVRLGLMAASEEYAGYVDADGSFEPAECDRLFNLCASFSLDAVIGSRDLKRAPVDLPPLRRLASGAFKRICRILFAIPFLDTQCGLKVFRRAALDGVLEDLELADFAFDVDLLYRLAKSGARIAEEPIAWTEKSGSTVNVVRTSMTMLLSILRLRLRRSPIGKMPYVDWLARQSVITVASGVRVLMLADRSTPERVRLSDELARKWAEIGYRVDVHAESRLRFWFWYVFGTDRLYDVLVEIASDRPYLLPCVSVKQTFVVRTAVSRTAAAIYDRWYAARKRIAFYTPDMLDELPAKMHAAAVTGPVYSARFFWIENRLTLTYTDKSSGLHCEQPIPL